MAGGSGRMAWAGGSLAALVNRIQRTKDSNEHADHRRGNNHLWFEHIYHKWQAVYLHVDIAHALAHPDASRDTTENTEPHDHQYQFDVMQTDGKITVTKSLEAGDLFSL